MVLVMPIIARLRRRIMPVLRAIAAIGGAAGDVDDAPRPPCRRDRGNARRRGGTGRRGLQVDGQRPRPGRVPLLVGRIVGDALVDAGIVDQHVDPPAELVERGVPDRRAARRDRRGRRRSACRCRWSNGRRRCGRASSKRVSGRADAAAGAGEEDVHGPPISAASSSCERTRQAIQSDCRDCFARSQ